MRPSSRPVRCPRAKTADTFLQLTDRLSVAIKNGHPLSGLDWARALMLTEICWASDILGAASEFGTNLPDERLLLARGVQLAPWAST